MSEEWATTLTKEQAQFLLLMISRGNFGDIQFISQKQFKSLVDELTDISRRA